MPESVNKKAVSVMTALIRSNDQRWIMEQSMIRGFKPEMLNDMKYLLSYKTTVPIKYLNLTTVNPNRSKCSESIVPRCFSVKNDPTAILNLVSLDLGYLEYLGSCLIGITRDPDILDKSNPLISSGSIISGFGKIKSEFEAIFFTTSSFVVYFCLELLKILL